MPHPVCKGHCAVISWRQAQVRPLLSNARQCPSQSPEPHKLLVDGCKNMEACTWQVPTHCASVKLAWRRLPLRMVHAKPPCFLEGDGHHQQQSEYGRTLYANKGCKQISVNSVLVHAAGLEAMVQ